MKTNQTQTKLLHNLSISLLTILSLTTLNTSIVKADSNSDTTSQNTPANNQIRSNSSGWGVNSNYPVVPNSQISQLPCYMQTADGKTLDLWRICAGGLIKQLLTTGRCVKCNLSGINLSNLDLSNLNLSGANLTGANLTGTNLTGANLTNTIMPDGKVNGEMTSTNNN
jgi:uncharacterized protein YjbI with pentapeptide repeats